jgi:membrane protein
LAGGVFASAAWYGIGSLFALLVASSSKYSAIYSSLAAAVLFIIWVNIGWLIVLVGAHIARYVQHPHLLAYPDDGAEPERVEDEPLALDVMVLIGQAHYFDRPTWTREALASRGLGSPDRIEALLRCLREARLIVATNDEPEAYVPARSIDGIELREILAVVRARRAKSLRLAAVRHTVERIDEAIARSLGGETLKDLVLSQEESAPSTPLVRREAVTHPMDASAAAHDLVPPIPR